MTIKSKKGKAEKLKAPALPKRLKTESICKDEVIWELYNECLKIKKSKSIKNVKIYLQNVEFPVPVDYKTNYLNNLKKGNIIDNYELKDEEENLPNINIERPVEPDIDLLSLMSEEDYRNVPKKYLTLEHSENDYVAIIRCYPQKIIEHFKNDFKKINQKRKIIMKKKEIEDLFEKEQILRCGELKFGTETGNTIYRNTIANFKPDSKEYNLFKELLDHINRRRSIDRLTSVIFPRQRESSQWKNYQNKVKWFINNIRKKLEMYGKNPKNEDLFEPCNGYRMKCKKE